MQTRTAQGPLLPTALATLLVLLLPSPGTQAQEGGDKNDTQGGNRVRVIDSLNRQATTLRFSDPKRAMSIGEKALKLARKKEDRGGIARALEIKGEIELFHNNFKKGKKLLRKADSIRKIMGDKAGCGEQRLETGVIYLNKHEYEKADSIFEEAGEFFKKANELERVAKSHHLRSRTFQFQSKYPKALKQAHAAKFWFDSADSKAGRALTYRQIGRVFWNQGNQEKAKKAYEKAVKLYEETGDEGGKARAHDLMGQYFLENKVADSAIHHYRKAIELRPGSTQNKGIAYSRVNLAQALLWKERADSSEMMTRKALKVFEHYRDPTGLINAYKLLGKIRQKRGELDSALRYFQKGIPKAKEIKSFEEQAALYRLIAETYDHQGKGSKAYDALKKASTYEDSLALMEQKEKMAELTAKYDMRERKKELKLKEAQLERNRLRFYLVGGGLCLVLLFSGFLYFQFRQKKKANIALTQKNQVIEEKNREILQSLQYASHIQSAVLPDQQMIQNHFRSGFVLFKPRDMVSGDLYWMEEYDGRFYLAVVDCTGHGVPGAMISILGHNGLNKAIMEKKLSDPADILSFLDEQVKETLGQPNDGKELRDGMDVALCCYEPNSQELSFAGAIEPLYLLRKGADRIEEYKGDRQPIGGIIAESGKKCFTSHKLQLREGDCFYIFSDGYPDQFGGDKGKKLKYKEFRKILLEYGGQTEFKEQGKALDRVFEEWRGDHEQVDDVLIIGAKL